MRDMNIIRQLLQKAADNDNGRIVCEYHGSMTTDQKIRHHHALLACDRMWLEPLGVQKTVFRITAAGYDFLENHSQ